MTKTTPELIVKTGPGRSEFQVNDHEPFGFRNMIVIDRGPVSNGLFRIVVTDPIGNGCPSIILSKTQTLALHSRSLQIHDLRPSSFQLDRVYVSTSPAGMSPWALYPENPYEPCMRKYRVIETWHPPRKHPDLQFIYIAKGRESAVGGSIFISPGINRDRFIGFAEKQSSPPTRTGGTFLRIFGQRDKQADNEDS